MADEFKVGDVVQLKSGGPKMTVSYVGKLIPSARTRVNCDWFEETKKHSGEFLPEMLKKIQE